MGCIQYVIVPLLCRPKSNLRILYVTSFTRLDVLKLQLQSGEKVQPLYYLKVNVIYISMIDNMHYILTSGETWMLCFSPTALFVFRFFSEDNMWITILCTTHCISPSVILPATSLLSVSQIYLTDWLNTQRSDRPYSHADISLCSGWENSCRTAVFQVASGNIGNLTNWYYFTTPWLFSNWNDPLKTW